MTEPPAGTIPPAETWTETADEKTLRTGTLLTKLVRIGPSTTGVNVSYRIDVEGVGPAVFKPRSGEALCRRSITPGTHYLREVAAFRMDALLGFRLVPVTVIRTIDGEVGSLQRWVLIDGWLTGHLKVDAARMAAFDYLIANTDRHVFNTRTQESGRPSAIDNGLCLPRDAGDPIRSRWTRSHLHQPLHDQAVVEIRSLSGERASSILLELGIEDQAIGGFRERLQELQETGQISNTAWGGEIRGT